MNENGFQLSNKAYDVLRRIVLYILPGLGTFYFAVAGIWGLPYGEQVVGTLAALATLLGTIIGISSKNYNKTADGDILVDSSNPEKDVVTLSFNKTTDELKVQDKVTLKVNDPTESQ